MTVGSQASQVVAIPNGIQTTFNYSFAIPGNSPTDQSNAQLVYQDASGNQTTLANNQWSITGVSTPTQQSTGGTFSFTTGSNPAPSGSFLILSRVVPYVQQVVLTNQGTNLGAAAEQMGDLLEMQVQQIRNQTILVTVSDSLFAIFNAADTSKVAKFSAGGISTSTSVTVSFYNGGGTMVLHTGSQTIYDKTLISPIINGGTFTGTFTFSGTISGGIITSSTISASVFGTGTITSSNIVGSTFGPGSFTGLITGSGTTITGFVHSGGTVTSSTISASVFGNGTVTASTVSASTIGNSTLTASVVTSSTISSSVIGISTITNSTVTSSTITASTITGSIINGSFNTITNIPTASLTAASFTLGTTTVSLGQTVTTFTGMNFTSPNATGGSWSGPTITGSCAASGAVWSSLGTVSGGTFSNITLSGTITASVVTMLMGPTSSVSPAFASAKLDLAGTNGALQALSQTRWQNSANGATLVQGMSRGGTVGTHVAVQSGDGIGQTNAYGSDGSTFVLGGVSGFFVDGSVTTGAVPAFWSLQTAAAGTATEAIRSNSSQQVFFPLATTTAAAANAVLDNATTPSQQLKRSTSSVRFKRDIEDLWPASADTFISKGRPIWYRSSVDTDRQDWSWYGYSAEEVAALDPRLVHYGYREEDYEWREEPADDCGATKRVRILRDGARLVPDGVMYERVVCLLHSYIKRLEERVAALEGRDS